MWVILINPVIIKFFYYFNYYILISNLLLKNLLTFKNEKYRNTHGKRTNSNHMADNLRDAQQSIKIISHEEI